jgi:glycolate oxidase FAD binding subunit
MGVAQDIQEQVQTAAAAQTPLAIQGGNSKAFYGRTTAGKVLSLSDHHGILDYTPSELVISARAGTLLTELESVLAQEDQMLSFEPPHFGESATLGGCVACGLSGPRRPYTGAVRDFVLGVNCINGKGEVLRLGGQVMKNVAGYDLSRTLTGSLGTLAVLLDVHLRVLPRPALEITLVQSCSATTAVENYNRWAGQPLPLSGACHLEDQLYLRLSGMAEGVQAAATAIGGELLDNAGHFWEQLREQQLPFFADDMPLWRLSVPAATPPLALDGAALLDWGGAQRWLRSELPAAAIRSTVAAVGGHATLFRGGDRSSAVFQPLQPALLALHQRLKNSLDPAGIFNPGRMYQQL